MGTAVMVTVIIIVTVRGITVHIHCSFAKCRIEMSVVTGNLFRTVS